MANDYTDNYDGIATGQPLSAQKMTNALNTKEKVANKKDTISNSAVEYPSAKAVYAHTSSTNNPHGVTAAQVGARPASWTPGKADVGLGNVDNTSDANKPISTAVNTRLTAIDTAFTTLSFFPAGTILTFSTAAWNATSAVFKNIWKICNGQNGTPNLTGKFLRGGTASDATGGGTAVLSEANLLAHTHSVSGSAVSAGAHTHKYYDSAGNSRGNLNGVNVGSTYTDTSSAGAHTHTISGTAAANSGHTAAPFEVVPAFYTVIYIMKVA